MTESVTDSVDTTGTGHTDTTGTSVKLGRVPKHRLNEQYYDGVLPELPSHKFKYTVWHELRETALTGDQLHAPRVRMGPKEREKEFYKLEEEGLPIHHSLKGGKRQDHRNEFEKWEEAEVINLSYQHLCDGYQEKNFRRILARCISAIHINLVNNELVQLHVTFPRCEYLNLNNNFMKSFKDFPEVPKVKCVTAAHNAIQSFNGLSRLAHTPIQELSLQGNPIAFFLNYRQTVFQMLPNLRMLDGIPRLPSDSEFDSAGDQQPSSCSIL